MPPTKARRLSLSRAIWGWNGKDIPRVRRREDETAGTDTGIKREDERMRRETGRRAEGASLPTRPIPAKQIRLGVGWVQLACLFAWLLAAVGRAWKPVQVGTWSPGPIPLRGTCLVRPASVAARGQGGMRGWPLSRWLQGRLRRCRRGRVFSGQRSGCSVASAVDERR